MASFTELIAIIEISEPPGRLWKRVKREYQRVGFLRFLDVLAFRLYYRAILASSDENWEHRLLSKLERQYQPVPAATRILRTPSPNSAETESLLREVRPDVVIARCKSILKPGIYNQARTGTFVMHPGICPQYRNAHGCFWALVRRDVDNVGMTLLKIDEGVDSGPVYGYYRANIDEVGETHTMIQDRVVFDNLNVLREKLEQIAAGAAQTIDTSGHPTATWGQPWLSSYFSWKRAARKARRLQ